MKKILVVGFGNMGCRHVQSLLSHKSEYEIHVVEPFDQNIEINSGRIGAVPGDFKRYRDLNELSGPFDLAIVATSSRPRFDIVKFLLSYGVRLFLLEKIVFQSDSQFRDIIRLLDEKKAEAYCNFVSRYFPSYNAIKDQIKYGAPVSMTVHGGQFGLGCNSIHYIDMFQYLTGSNSLVMSGTELNVSKSENKRGSEYKEFTGILVLDDDYNRLTIISEENFTGGVCINIEVDGSRYFLSEQTQQMFTVKSDSVSASTFEIIPTSKLTHPIVQDIFAGYSRLTTIRETVSAHSLLFRSFNSILFNTLDEKNLCPIT